MVGTEAPSHLKKDIFYFTIYKIQDSRYTRNNVDTLRERGRVFVGICYVSIYSRRYKVISK